MARKGVFVGAYISPSLKSKIKSAADEEGISSSEFVKRALEMADLTQQRCGTCGSVPDAEREAKVTKYNALRDRLWDTALYGNPLASTMSAALIRLFEINGPNGEEPDSA